MEAIESAVGKAVRGLIRQALGSDTIPVFLEDEAAVQEDFSAIIVAVRRSTDIPVLVENNHRASTKIFEVDVELWGLTQQENKVTQSERFQKIDAALFEPSEGSTVDFSRFSEFIVFTPSSSQNEQDADGRRTRMRTYRIGAAELTD